MSINPVDELARRAEWAERAAPREAEAAWNALIAADPNHPRALFALGRRRIEQGDPAGALALLARAEAGDRGYEEIPSTSRLRTACWAIPWPRSPPSTAPSPLTLIPS